MSWRERWIEWQLRRKWWFTQEEMRLWGITAQTPEKVHEYLSINSYKALRLYIEDMPWHPIVDNKWISKCYFAAHGIAMPETYGLLDPRYGFSTAGRPLQNAEQLFAWLDENGVESMVMKHIGELKGNSVFVIDRIHRDQSGKAHSLELLNGEQLNRNDVQELIGLERLGLRGYLLEERLPLHPQIATLTAGGVASIRINTLCCHDLAKAQLAYIRLGRATALTDHGARGGINVAVDVESGTLGKGIIFDSTGAPQACPEHPDSRQILEGRQIPDWKQYVALALDAARYCTGIPCVGWDVVPTAQGPRIIEGNVSWSMIVYQGVCGGLLANGVADDWRSHLGADLPDGSWRWRRKHWNKCRRLNFWERCVTNVATFISKRAAATAGAICHVASQSDRSSK